jgi:hypothetical protein
VPHGSSSRKVFLVHAQPFVGSRQVVQQVNPEFGAELARRPADCGGQIREPARFRYSQPHQPDPVAVETPVQQGGRAEKAVHVSNGSFAT